MKTPSLMGIRAFVSILLAFPLGPSRSWRPSRLIVWTLPAAMLVLSALAPPSLAQGKTARVGYLAMSEAETQFFLPQMRKILAERGWIEGKNLVIVGRFASGEPPQYSKAVKELAALKLDLIYAAGAPPMREIFPLKRNTPIVTTDFSSDPVASGYVEKYNRPGKNVTGVFLDAPQFAGKWLDILNGLVPNLKRLAVLWDPGAGSVHLNATKQIAQKLRIHAQVYEVRSIHEVEKAFAQFKGKHHAVMILPSPLAYAHSAELAELALKYRLPATSMPRTFAEAGGTVSYGPDLHELNKRAFDLAAKILDGAKAGDLPIETPTKFDFLINTKTAKKLGLKVPDRFLVGAELVSK